MSDLADQALAIANLKARYCLAADTAPSDPARARALFADVFTDDFVGDYGSGVIEGPAATIEFLCGAIERGSVWMVHMIHSPRIEVSGDTATGDWTVMAHSRRSGGDEMSVVLGRYADRFRRTAAGWRIERVAFWRPAGTTG